MLRTVVISLAALLAVSGLPPAPYIVQPDYAEAVNALPVATESPTEENGPIMMRRQQEQFVLEGIKNYVWRSLDMPCMPRAPPFSAITSAERQRLVQLVNTLQNSPDGYDRSGRLKRAQSFYPSCERPSEQDPRVARLMPSLDVYFNLTSYFPTVLGDVTIEKATLRVFKIPGQIARRTLRRSVRRRPQTGGDPTVRISLHAYTSPRNDSSQREGAPWSADVTPWSSDVTPWSSDVRPWSGASGASSPSGERTGPRLVDQLTVSAAHRGWLTLDVRSAVRAWKLGADNWGFLLTVEDLDGRQLSPDSFFEDMECDVAVPSSPVPGLLVAQDADLVIQSEPRYPVLDLMTSEPAADSLMPDAASNGADQPCPPPAGGWPALSRRQGATPPALLPRRHRHGRHRRTDEQRWRHLRQR